MKDHYLLITFVKDLKVTREQVTKMINCGFTIASSYYIDNYEYIKQIKIYEMSLKT